MLNLIKLAQFKYKETEVQQIEVICCRFYKYMATKWLESNLALSPNPKLPNFNTKFLHIWVCDSPINGILERYEIIYLDYQIQNSKIWKRILFTSNPHCFVMYDFIKPFFFHYFHNSYPTNLSQISLADHVPVPKSKINVSFYQLPDYSPLIM